MKNKIILIILILIPIVFAGNSKTLRFSEDDEKIFYNFKERDKVDFNLVNGTHTIILDEVYPTKEIIELIVFPYSYEGSYISLSKNNYIMLDFDRDRIDDMRVKLSDITSNESALLLFHKVSPTSEYQTLSTNKEKNISIVENNTINEITGEVTGSKTTDYKNGIIITISIIIVLLILTFIFRKIKKQ